MTASIRAIPEGETLGLNLEGAVKPGFSSDFCVGSDRAAIHLRDSHFRDLSFVRTGAGFRHLRCHGLFNDEMGILDPAHPDSGFRWDKVDVFLDRLVSLGMVPFIEVGDMPAALARHDRSIFHWKWHHSPPESWERWEALVGEFTWHVTARYGRGAVREWLFEIWNEPNLDGFWSSTRDEYFELYRRTVKAIRAVDGSYKVGGPSTAGLAWIPEFISFCVREDVPLDFLTSHHYGCDEGFLDTTGTARLRLLWGDGDFVDDVARARQEIRASGRPDLPLHITEWGPSYSCRDPMHDSYICASWILEKVRGCAPHAASMSYWAFSDQFEENGPGPAPFHGGFGLLNSQGIPKPAFFAYSFLHRLGTDRLETGSDRVLASRLGNGFRILVWDWSVRVQDQPNTPYFSQLLPAAPVPCLFLELHGLQRGYWRIRSTRVGYMSNDAMGRWIELGRPVGPDESPDMLPEGDLLKELRQAALGEPESDRVISCEGSKDPVLELMLRQNDVLFLELDPV